MTESNTETPTPDAQTGDGGTSAETTTEATTPAPVATYKVKVPEGNKGSGRFAVYDKTLERYVGDVADSKPSSTDARKLVGDHGYAVVEV